MRVLHAAQFLQAVPHPAAAARFADERFIDDHLLQHVVGVDHEKTGHFVRQPLLVAREGFLDRDHAAVPLRTRNPRQVPRVAAVAGDEIDQRESEVFGHRLVRLVLIDKGLHRPIQIDLRVSLEIETRGPVGPGGRVVGKGRKCARLHRRRRRRRRHQIGRQAAIGSARAREHAEQGRAAIRQPFADPLAKVREIRGAQLQHVHLVQPDGHIGDLTAAHAGGEISLPDRRLLEDVVGLQQDLDRQAG